MLPLVTNLILILDFKIMLYVMCEIIYLYLNENFIESCFVMFNSQLALELSLHTHDNGNKNKFPLSGQLWHCY